MPENLTRAYTEDDARKAFQLADSHEPTYQLGFIHGVWFDNGYWSRCDNKYPKLGPWMKLKFMDDAGKAVIWMIGGGPSWEVNIDSGTVEPPTKLCGESA